MWRTDQYDAKRIYLRPHSWNVSIIEDFDNLFDVERDEGWRHYDFAELDMAPWDTSSLTSGKRSSLQVAIKLFALDLDLRTTPFA